MTGYLLAFISSLFFSIYVVPRKLSKLKPIEFSQLMAIGYFTSTVILYLFKPVLGFHETLSPTLLLAVLGGAIWAASFVTFVKAIDILGLSRSNQWKNLQGPVAAIGGLIVLNEVQTTQPVFVLLAALAIFASAAMLTISANKEEARANLRGVYMAALAGLGFGTTAVIQKYVTTNVGVYSQQVVLSFSIMASIALYLLITRQKLPRIKPSDRQVQLGLIAGILYLGASFFQLQSYRFLPASIAFSVVQLNTVWTIGIGILVFKEISFKANRTRILLGLLLAVIGIVLLGLARK